MKSAIVLWLALLPTASALAQEQERPVSTFEQRLDTLAVWLKEYRAWERWFEQWGNRVARNFQEQPIWERKERPTPPFWLEAECRGYLGADEPLATACYILERWDEHPRLILQRVQLGLAQGPQAGETVTKTSFLHRVHLTGLWMQARYPAASAYGIVGMQVGVIEVGRFTLPAIGVMLVMMEDGQGGYLWQPTTTVGVGFRICDFVPPLIRKRASLHFNVARTNHIGRADGIHPGMVDVNLLGLSVSATKRR